MPSIPQLPIKPPHSPFALAKWLGACFICIHALAVNNHADAVELHFQVDPKPEMQNVPRLGLNLGDWASWGASQLSSNVIKNPGFEGIVDRAIVIVKTANSFGFIDDNQWTSRPNGFWNGAKFQVLSGISAGKQGMIALSLDKGKEGLPEFKVTGLAPDLQPGDAISLTLVNDQVLPSEWWFPSDSLPGQFSIVDHHLAANTPGKRALSLNPMINKPAMVSSYLDTISPRAGKMLPINGTWKLRFLAKKTDQEAKLSVRFRRLNNGRPFLQEDINELSTTWQLIERDFLVEDTEAASNLELAFIAEGSGSVIVDDVELMAQTKKDSSFRSEVIAALKQLRPGYLRDWQGQLGDSFNNRVASSFARRNSRYRPGNDSTFSYGLPEFLQLSAEIGAQPWLVLPTTLEDEELIQMGRYLRQQIDNYNFAEVIVEFGNENWNSVFRAAGIQNAATHGFAANRAFEKLLLGANSHSGIVTVVNSQYVNPWISGKLLENSTNIDGVAVAPYFFYELNNADDGLQKLFDQDDFYAKHLANTKAKGKELLVYEVNMHTTQGNADALTRNHIVNSAAAGAALAKRLLTGLDYGISRQMLYTLAQYDAYIDSKLGEKQLVELWGVARDLSDENVHLRATGQAMALLNTILPADKYPVTNLQPNMSNEIKISAFHNQRGWSLVLVSCQAKTQNISVDFPEASQQNWQIQLLNNAVEPGKDYAISKQILPSSDRTLNLTLPGYSLLVATPASPNADESVTTFSRVN